MEPNSALLVVDVQNDFCPGGALPVPNGDQVVPVLNRYLEQFRAAVRPIFASRDWHPPVTRHFAPYGGMWPVHCVQGTRGAEFHPDLRLPPDAIVVSKGMDPNDDGYSAFDAVDPQGRSLETLLRERGIEHLYVGGLATDYCVKHTALDALRRGLRVTVLEDACRGVDVHPGDSERALEELRRAGADVRSGSVSV